MKNCVFVLLVLLVSGCAVGNKYNYQASSISLPMKTESSDVLVLLVRDLRPYILNGEKAPDFVGLQRGGFGNPFDVTTVSGKPMATEMTAAIADGLANSGYRVVEVFGDHDMAALVARAASEAASRIVVLRVKEWKSDIMMSITMHCDMTLAVYQADGGLLAENSARFTQSAGGAQMGGNKNSQSVTKEFAKQIGYLFNEASVREALN